jgi:hypothetical protein
MSSGKQCLDFDVERLDFAFNENQREIYQAYGRFESNVNETARQLEKDVSSISRTIRSIDKRWREGRYFLITERTNADHEYQEDELIQILRAIKLVDPERHITRTHFRAVTAIPDSSWTHIFGTFEEFVRQSNLSISRNQHRLEKNIAIHKSRDKYDEGNERHEWAGNYLKKSNSRIKTNLVFSDTHDILIDPFYRRVLIATAKRIQPDRVILNGDGFDLSEFGRYTIDPRSWDAVGRIKAVHSLLEDLREAAPDAEFWFMEGNHEFRLVRHLMDQTPALRAVLADLHGMDTATLLGINKYEINYVSKADLKAQNIGEIKRQVAKNYHVFDDCYLVGHYKMLDYGLDGTSGHEHKHMVWPVRKMNNGAGSWHQYGCGHVIDAEYCNANLIWNLGFGIVHTDCVSKTVNQNYVSIGTFAEVGGEFYERRSDEMVGAFVNQLAA